MAAINIPVNAQLQNVSQLQRQIQQATQNIRINLLSGNSARSLTALSQPLGRLTGQADEFTKSMDAANARVLAFGASVGVLNAFTNAFKSLVASTIEVEKALKSITVVGDQFAGSTKELGQGLFNVAKLTGQSFSEVSKAALEFSRQGLNVEQTLQRTKDALILTRLTGLDSAKAVDGLTAAFNAFSKAGISTSQILNKLAAVDQAFAVSSADLIEGFNRSAAVAQNAGVSFDELAGIITSLQTQTSRGGAVIGNALKTIFTRIQDKDTLEKLSDLGIAVTDVQNRILPARQILQNLANDVKGLGKITQSGIFEDVAGTFQINQLISLVGDLNKQNSIAASATKKAAGATNEAYTANEKLNQSLDAILNKVATSGKQIGSILGDLGFSDNLKGLLDGLNSFLEYASETLQGDSIGAKFAQSIVKGIGSVLTGPGVGLFLAIIGKLSYDLIKFGTQSLKTFFNIGQAAKQQQQVQESIVQTLLRNQSVLSQIVNTQGGQNAQAQAFLNILRQEEQALQNIRTIAGGIAAPVIAQGYRPGPQGLSRSGSAAGGYLPAQEAADVRRGVGGASPSSKVVAIPNFAFGGGKRGTMIANTSEYIVPNYAGGGSAIFNQDMAKTMGLPPGAKKITASGGFIPNFANTNQDLAILGLYGQNGNIDGSPVYTLQSQRPNLFKDIKKNLEKNVTNLVRSYANRIGKKINVPVVQKDIKKSLNQIPSVSGYMFEDVLNQLAGPNFDTATESSSSRIDFPLTQGLKEVFGVTGPQKYAESKLNPYTSDAIDSIRKKQLALAGGVLGPQERTSVNTNDLRSKWLNYKLLPGRSKGNPENQAIYKEIVRALGLNPTTQKDTLNNQINRLLGTAANGYIPNFAETALQAAISRERSAGVAASQIYIDQSPALKSSANPMGLMVANRRDEPAGGFQGISRARREGVNPKTYGAVSGFVPNYANQPFGASPEKGILSAKNAEAFNKLLADIIEKLKKNEISLEEALKNAQDLADLTTNKKKKKAELEQIGKKEIEKANKESKIPQKSSGDALAKVFALQSALVGLTAVFEETAGEGSLVTEGFKKVGGVVTGILSGAALLSAGLGPLGIGLAALTSGFNIVKALWPNAIQLMLESFGGLSKAGQEASENLNKFGEKIASGGVSPEQALADAKKQAEEARLRIKAAQQGVSTKTSEGGQKDPAKLARELIVKQAREALNSKEYQAGIFKQVGVNNETIVESSKISAQSKTISRPIFDIAKAKFQDLNESTQNIIFDILEEAVSTTKDGLIVLAKSQGLGDIDPKTIVTEKDLNDLRATLLSSIVGGEEASSIIEKAIKKSRDARGNIDQNKLQEILRKSDEFANIPVNKLDAIIKSLPVFDASKPENATRIRLDEFLRSFNDFNAEIDRSITATTSLFEGIVGSQAFSALSEQRQSELKTQLDRFKFTTSSQKTERGIITEARTLAASQAKSLAATEGNAQLKKELDQFAQSFSNLDELEKNLNYFSKEVRLAGQDAEKFKEDISSLINKNKDFQSSRETERKLLEFSIQERENELNSIKSFYQGLDTFNQGIRKQEARIRQIDFQIRSSQQSTDFRKEMLGLTTGDLDTYRSETARVESEGFAREQGLRKEQADIQAKIELDRALYTQDNIIALNKNTEALEGLYRQFSVEKIQSQIDEILLRPGGATPSDQQTLEVLQNARANLLGSSKNTPSVNSAQKFNDLINAQTEQDRKAILDSVPNETQRNNLKQAYEDYYNKLKISAEDFNNEAELRKQSLINLKNLDEARDTYSSTLNAEARQIEESLRRQPMSMGQYLTESRRKRITLEEKDMSPEAVREARSSFRRGFGDSITEIQAKTADFKNEIGREIPQLFSSNLTQGLNDAISGAKDLKTALTDAATSFLNAITQKNIQNLADMFTGGVGGFFTKKASGGLISGGSGTKDDVPAMLMGGEYVIKKSAVKKYGSKFLDSLNNGGIKGFAKGGGVQSGTGGFYVPGDFGEGAITGKNQLLAFAGQSFTGGQYDRMGGFGMSGASISLEPESARLTAFGRENSPIFERVQQAKEEAFNVYLDQLKQESAYKEQLKQIEEAEKARKKQLQTAIISAVVSTAVSVGASAFSTGAENAIAEAGAKAGTPLKGLNKFTTGFSGGLKNLGSLMPGGVKPTFQLNDFAKANRLGMSIGDYRGNMRSNTIIPYRPKLGPSRSLYSSGQYKPAGSNRSIINTGYGLSLPTGRGMDLNNPLLPSLRAGGGFISGGSGVRDDVPAMLTGGEFVLNNRATRKLGVQNLNRLNAGATDSQQSSGGVSDALISKLDELIQTTRESSKDNVVVNVSGMNNSGEKRSEENASTADKELQRKIKEAVLAVIAQEKRLGGSLNK